MAETIQEMIARKRREKAEGKTDKPVVDNEAARRNMVTAVSTASRGTDQYQDAQAKNSTSTGSRETVSLQDSKTKDLEVEKSTGQKLLEDRQRRAKAKAYIEANSK